MKMTIEPGFAWIPPSDIERRVRSIPLPKKIKSSFIRSIQVWSAHSGTEWTVGRLKSFKDCLLASYAEGGVLTHKPEWFRTTRSGMLDGIYGRLWRYAMEDTASLKQVLFLVNIYTAAFRTESTDSMLSDIKSEIQQAPVSIPRRGHGARVGYGRIFAACDHLNISRVGVKSPVPLSKVLPGKESHSSDLADDVSALAGTPIGKKFSKLLSHALGAENVLAASKFTTVVGKIGLTHEPGLKTRYYAAPNQVIQRALEPLKEALQSVLPRIQWDCTLDQRRADEVITSALKKGKTVHSVDMSKATDNFPWKFQYMVCKRILMDNARCRPFLRLMDSVVREGYWIMPDGSRVRWTKGQPLGLGPSFPLFTLSHGLLLYILNGYKWSRDFFVLGDDVVILNDSLHQKYREVLAAWEVEISEAKSFSSCNIAQFAGVTYTANGSLWIPKWLPLTRENLLDSAAWWFPGLTKGLKDNSLVETILAMPEPYGCGINPKGLPLDSRFSSDLVEAYFVYKQRREDRVRTQSTRPDLDSLHDTLLKKGVPEETSYALIGMMKSNSFHEEEVGDQVRLFPTGNTLRLYDVDLFHRATITGGYPPIRLSRRRVDPYSLGSLGMWKRILRAVHAKNSDSE